MNFNENSVESDWNLSSLKKRNENEVGKRKILVKHKPNRSFSETWLNLFSPWLKRSDDDRNKPFCRACQRTLDNNRFRLQRHERTAKHARNQEILLNEGEDVVRLLHLNKNRKRHFKKESPVKSYSSDIDHTNFEDEIPIKKLKTQKIFKSSSERIEADSNSNTIAKREYHDINDYFYSHPPPPHQTKKDHFDLFFEAISASVKNLPPKLAAEVKSRVSQVIAEFELRAICEKEAQEKAQQQSVVTIPTQVTSVVTIDPVITTENNAVNSSSSANQQNSECTPTVTQYVYAYQQKKEIN
ncbi:uncharacterized protein ACRADG_004515 [Cochliomyia hominivorax]